MNTRKTGYTTHHKTDNIALCQSVVWKKTWVVAHRHRLLKLVLIQWTQSILASNSKAVIYQTKMHHLSLELLTRRRCLAPQKILGQQPTTLCKRQTAQASFRSHSLQIDATAMQAPDALSEVVSNSRAHSAEQDATHWIHHHRQE